MVAFYLCQEDFFSWNFSTFSLALLKNSSTLEIVTLCSYYQFKEKDWECFDLITNSFRRQLWGVENNSWTFNSFFKISIN